MQSYAARASGAIPGSQGKQTLFRKLRWLSTAVFLTTCRWGVDVFITFTGFEVGCSTSPAEACLMQVQAQDKSLTACRILCSGLATGWQPG